MKNYLSAPFLALGAALILGACDDEELMPLPPAPPPQVGTQYEATQEITTTQTPTGPTEATPPPPPPTVDASAPPAVGRRVPGHPELVASPHTDDPNAVVNVSGLPPGTEVKDPYSGKTFLVP